MPRYERGREWLKARIVEAQGLGHTVRIERRDPPSSVPEGRVKFWAVCSCGYRSTARATEGTAVAAATWHVGSVTGEADGRRVVEERRRNGLAPESDTPTAPDVPEAVTARL